VIREVGKQKKRGKADRDSQPPTNNRPSVVSTNFPQRTHKTRGILLISTSEQVGLAKEGSLTASYREIMRVRSAHWQRSWRCAMVDVFFLTNVIRA
jgi:hypothetical protein